MSLSLQVAVWLLCGAGSTAAPSSRAFSNTQAEQVPPQEVVLGRCTLHLWPRSSVWRLQEGDVMQMVANVTENCRGDVTLTISEMGGGSVVSQQMVWLRSATVVWSPGRAHPARHGFVLLVRVSHLNRTTVITKLLDVEFAPRIKMLSALPYQGQNLFIYFLHLCVQRQKELITGKSMKHTLGWDVGESTALRVQVSGNPKPRIVWRVNKQDVAPGQSLQTNYVAGNESVLTSTESVFEIELRYLTLKMAQQGLKLITRNKVSQKILRISLPVNMFPVAEQINLVDAVTSSIGLVALIFAGMVVIHVTNGIYVYVSRIAMKQWDGITYSLISSLIPVRTLSNMFHLFIGFCISLGLLTCFSVKGKYMALPRGLLYSLFTIAITCLYGRYTRVRAAFWLVLIGMISHTGMFLLIVSTFEMMLDASRSITKNFQESSLQVHCISQIHVELFRESMLAYLNPVVKRKSDYAEVQLVKERDMALAQESMKLSADIALSDVQGDKFGEQKVSQKKNTKVDREYKVRRFAEVKKKAQGGGVDRTKLRKKFVFKSLNICQDIGSNVLIECLKKKHGVFKKCMAKFPGILKPLGRGVCGLMVKHVDCQTMYKNTVKNFKCESPVDAKEVTGGLLLLRDGPTMFYGDSSPQDLQQVYDKPVTIQYVRDKPRESKGTTVQKMEDARGMMSTVYIIIIIILVLQSTNKVLGEMIRYDLNINWENIYISSYFRKIDNKRGKLGFPRLLPLKGIEKRMYIEGIFSTKAKEEERDQVKLKASVCFAVQLLTAIIFMVDYLAFTVTMYEVVRENMTYTLTIDDYLRVSSRGDSFFALLINLVFEKLNVDNQMFKTYRVDKCNPNVSYPNLQLYARQQAFLLFLFLFTFVLPCPDRLKHVIFRIYYPKREKKRQTKLYTNMLLTRERFIQLALKQMLWRRAHGKLTTLHDPQWQDLLLRQFRAVGFLLRVLFKSTCSICRTTGGSRYVMCRGPGCTMVYCRQCWRVLGEKCLSCSLVMSKEMMERFGTSGEGLSEE